MTNTAEIANTLQDLDADYFHGEIDDATYEARRAAAWAAVDDAEAVSAVMMGAESMPEPPTTPASVTRTAREVADVGSRWEDARSEYSRCQSQSNADVLALWAQSLLNIQRRTEITWETEARIMRSVRDAHIGAVR